MKENKTKEEATVVEKKFITDEELTSVKSAVEAINRVQVQVGGIELQKHDLMHSMKTLTDSLESIQTALQEKYGDVVIDITTGEMQENVPNTED